MPLSIGIGDKSLEFQGVHAVLAILGFCGLLWLTIIKIVNPEAFVGIATVAVQGYLEYRRNGKSESPDETTAPKTP